MTDKINSITVVLDDEYRVDSNELLQLTNAIRAIRHVISVEQNVSDLTVLVAQCRAESGIKERLFEKLDYIFTGKERN